MTYASLRDIIGKVLGSRPGWLPKSVAGPGARALVMALGTGAAGRYIAAPVAHKLSGGRLDKDKLKRNMTLLGLGGGLAAGGIPAYYEYKAHGLKGVMPGLYGKTVKDFSPDNPQSMAMETFGFRKQSDAYFHPSFALNDRRDGEMADDRMGKDLFRPMVPVSQSLDNIRNNHWMSFGDKIQAQLQLVNAAKAEGKATGGLLRPSSLVDTTGQTMGNALPYMGIAYGLSKVLGLPTWAKRTGLGAGVAAGAWKTYLDRSR